MCTLVGSQRFWGDASQSPAPHCIRFRGNPTLQALTAQQKGRSMIILYPSEPPLNQLLKILVEAYHQNCIQFRSACGNRQREQNQRVSDFLDRINKHQSPMSNARSAHGCFFCISFFGRKKWRLLLHTGQIAEYLGRAKEALPRTACKRSSSWCGVPRESETNEEAGAVSL